VDLGCGEGNILFSLEASGLLKNAEKIIGVDISEARVNVLKRHVKNVIGIVSDATCVRELEDGAADVVVCTYVIEHVPNDALLLAELRRLMKKDGIGYVSTVLQKRRAFWLYRRGGHFRLDPTHLREYQSVEQFITLAESNNLEVIRVEVTRVRYSVVDMVLSVMTKLRVLTEETTRMSYARSRFLRQVRRLSVPLAGYFHIEVALRAS
jgi:2-polyprenyl-3-methyl-5-hydroxy-6-metoxy-1,4-benzoquinol methylase